MAESCISCNTGTRGEVLMAQNLVMQNLEFKLGSEYIELNQLLKLVGQCDSGGAGKVLVAGGTVLVDGKVELRKTCKVRTGSIVTLGGVRITVKAA